VLALCLVWLTQPAALPALAKTAALRLHPSFLHFYQGTHQRQPDPFSEKDFQFVLIPASARDNWVGASS
jgi:hypothetical protein